MHQQQAPQSRPSLDMQTIIGIAEKAAAIVMSHFRKQLKISIKEGDAFNFLTQADQESNQYIQAALKRAFPHDKFLLEETEDRPSDFAGRVWMVDPLDGTKEFIDGGERFSVLIGLCVDGRPVLGCVMAPVTDTIYWAEKGKGSYKRLSDNTYQRLQVNNVADFSKARALVSVERGESRPAEKVLAGLPIQATMPDGSLGLRAVRIAEGEAEFFVNTNLRACKWDSCAPQIILEEAGGKLTDAFGKSLNYSQPDHRWHHSFVGSNGSLHTAVIEQIGEVRRALFR